MKRAAVGLLTTAIATALAVSCDRIEDVPSICQKSDVSHVCLVPFEALYTQRDNLAGQLIRLDGVLVSGARSEPPGSELPVILLFPSVERAEMCNPGLAVELLTTSEKVLDGFRKADGGFVSVVGKLQQSHRGHWSQMQVVSAPTLISSEQHDLSCMKTPPPPKPEPGQR
jgi:hypothetical protein